MLIIYNQICHAQKKSTVVHTFLNPLPLSRASPLALKFNSVSSQARLKPCWALTLVALDEKVHESSLHGQPDTPRQVEQHGLKPWTN